MASINQSNYYTYPNDNPTTAAQNSSDTTEGQPDTPNPQREPLVSVIIPIYNAEPYLKQALESVQQQSYNNLEIICLNDGSTDNSLATIESFAKIDERFVVIDKQNEGYGATCNRGLDAAHGDWIAILEPDDWIELGMYADMIDFASQFNEPIDIIKTPYWRIAEPDTPKQQKLPCSYKMRVHPEHQPFVITDAIHLFHHHPSIWSALYSKAFLDEFAIRFKPIPGAGWADNPFLAETLLQARNIIYLDQAYYCYREDTKKKTKAFHQNNPDIPFDRWNEMLDVIERLGITDPAILNAHYSRGFMYMSGVIEEHGADDPAIREKITTMFNRMDPDLVLNYPRISPGVRRLFCEIRGLPAPHNNNLQYMSNLVEQGVYNLRNIGIKSTAISVFNYLTTYKSRSGNR